MKRVVAWDWEKAHIVTQYSTQQGTIVTTIMLTSGISVQMHVVWHGMLVPQKTAA